MEGKETRVDELERRHARVAALEAEFLDVQVRVPTGSTAGTST
jgi:hypothetical protein